MRTCWLDLRAPSTAVQLFDLDLVVCGLSSRAEKRVDHFQQCLGWS